MLQQPFHLITRCPLCQAAYSEQEVRLLGERGTSRLFHCTCHGCGHAMLAFVLETQGALSSVGLLTDLEAQDALRCCEGTPISSDECIHIHHQLEEDSLAFCQALLTSSAA